QPLIASVRLGLPGGVSRTPIRKRRLKVLGLIEIGRDWLNGLFSGSRQLEIRPRRITRQIICPRQTNAHFGIAFTDTVVLTYPGNGRFAQHPRLANVGVVLPAVITCAAPTFPDEIADVVLVGVPARLDIGNSGWLKCQGLDG